MSAEPKAAATAVEWLTALMPRDLHDLCDAAEAAIEAGGGFGWLRVPPREVMEAYWRGVLLVPERELLVARLDGVIGGSAQLWRPTRNNEAAAHRGTLTTFFLAPWARGFGLAARLVTGLQARAVERGLSVLDLDLRETQTRAIEVYEQHGFRRIGSHPHYARVDGRWVAGFYYTKDLEPAA